MNKKILIVSLLMIAAGGRWTEAKGQDTVWTLEGCRAHALEANKGLKVADEKRTEADALEKVALWQMLPKVSANGAYLWMEKSVDLLSSEEQERIEGVPLVGNLIAERLANVLATDTRNVTAGAVTVTQPVFMGGKLWALHKSAALLKELSGLEYDKKKEEILTGVDEAYWQVVSVKHKKELAEQYAALLDTLTKDVEELVAAEVATKGDLTKVRVKRNEAQMNLTKARNGLVLAKMLLAQRCGMPLESEYDVSDRVAESLSDRVTESLSGRVATQPNDSATQPLSHSATQPPSNSATQSLSHSATQPLSNSATQSLSHSATLPMDSVWARRRELRMLGIADSVAMQGVTIARSTLLPNIAVTGGYLMSHPHVTDGFQNEFKGMFFAGVVVNVPILHPGGFYSLKAAKAKRRETQWQMEEAKEMIELQVKKVSYELELAEKKLAEAQSNLENAEENLRLADESFHAGVVSSSDLMAAQTAWMQAKSEVVDAEIEIEMSKVYLHQALGEGIEN